MEVSPGGGKWRRFKYRFSDKEQRFSPGIYPDVPLARRKDKNTGIWIDGSSATVRENFWPMASIQAGIAR